MPCHDESAAALLGPSGPVAAAIPGFESRRGQVSMAAAVERCFEEQSAMVVESGTGTGKTFAYLVPALLSGKKVIVSTGTKPLQDQLFYRDLPSVSAALGSSANTALLKGRANYLCLYRLALCSDQPELLADRLKVDIEAVERWSHQTRSGDLNELTAVAEDSPARTMASSNTDNCLGTRCAHYDDCYVNRARRAALKADVLVINHHLFCADLVLREDGFGQLLPGADAVIFDEAHQLPEVASMFLGTSVSGHQIRELCRDTERAEREERSQVGGLLRAAARVDERRDSLLALLRSDKERLEWAALEQTVGFQPALNDLLIRLSELADLLELAAAAGEGLLRCWQRALRCAEGLGRFAESGDDRSVRWAESGRHSFRFHETPLKLGEVLRPHLGDATKSWLYTSATLSVKGDFTYFCGQLGIESAETLMVDSPFDYARQALLYIPTGLPDPGQAGYTREVVARALPVIAAAGGRTFFLFTSHSALKEAHSMLAGTGFTLLVQGQMPRTELLSQFRSMTGAVLLGTASFWEGVDVRGEALSCVIIDKLPFESPSDPVVRARLEAIEAGGGRPFVDHQLPHAVIALKQGVGRLIRDRRDSGVLMLCDPRLLSRGYGRVFLNSLPDMPLVRDVAEVEAFFARWQVER